MSKIVYGVRQSKITKGAVLASLGEKGLRKRDGQIGPEWNKNETREMVNLSSPRPAKTVPFAILLCLIPDDFTRQWRASGSSAIRQSKITKGTVLASLGEERLIKFSSLP